MIPATSQQAEAWLDDPYLPQLRKALTPGAMQADWARLFDRELQRLKAEIEDCRIERVQYRRHKRCRILYRLIFRHQDGHRSDQWIAAKLVRPGQGRRQFLKETRCGALSNGLWKSAYLLEEMDLLVHPFPYDPRMPGLTLAGNPSHIAQKAEEWLAQSLRNPHQQLTVPILQKVKYMPGKRCVLKFALAGDEDSRQPWISYFSKTFSDGLAAYHYRVLKTAQKQLAPKIQIPRPVLFWEQANTFWQESWPGLPLIDQLEELSWKDLFPQLGELAADLHSSFCPGLRRLFHAPLILRDASEDANALAWHIPQHRDSLQAILKLLQKRAGAIFGTTLPERPIHGAFRIEQLLINRNDFAIVDLDALSLGDPLFDVAEFWVSLQHLAFTRGFSLPLINEAAEGFVDAYARKIPWDVDLRRIAWYITAFLFGKMHDTLKNLDMPALNRFDEILSLQEHWAAKFS